MKGPPVDTCVKNSLTRAKISTWFAAGPRTPMDGFFQVVKHDMEIPAFYSLNCLVASCGKASRFMATVGET